MKDENKLIRTFTNPYWAFGVILRHCFAKMMDDKTFIKWEYFSGMGKFPDLEKPKTFNEKLQWLKLNDIHSEYVQMVDKYEAKEYVRGIIGDEHIIPTLGVWDSWEEINFSKLPNKFVLKTTHDSGGVAVCKDKSEKTLREAKKIICKSMKHNYFYEHREYPYKDIKPRIIAEQFMVDESGTELKDYKFFCFDGDPKMLLIVSGRGNDQRQDFYDMDFNLLPVQRKEHPNSGINRVVSRGFYEMKLIAEKLSAGIPHVRVDLYDINGKIYFGELTFFSGSGNIPFEPDEWDYKIGEWLQLPIE